MILQSFVKILYKFFMQSSSRTDKQADPGDYITSWVEVIITARTG